jgi:hypothetical protein
MKAWKKFGTEFVAKQKGSYWLNLSAFFSFCISLYWLLSLYLCCTLCLRLYVPLCSPLLPLSACFLLLPPFPSASQIQLDDRPAPTFLHEINTKMVSPFPTILANLHSHDIHNIITVTTTIARNFDCIRTCTSTAISDTATTARSYEVGWRKA